ncbi:MAG TPA: hypothetical protein DEB46_04435, partial [Myxococcales bacterium]|nr:hypothetical protein [Myxococcales bacterium]
MKNTALIGLFGIGLLPALVTAQKATPQPTLVPLKRASKSPQKAQPDYDRWRWSRGQGRARLLGGIAVIPQGANTRVVVRGNDAFGKVGLLRLSQPERLVIDLPNVRRPSGVRPILTDTRAAKRIRISNNGGILRAVIDLTDHKWLASSPRPLGNGFEVILRQPQQGQAKMALKPKAKTVRMTGSEIIEKPGFLRVRVTFSGKISLRRDPNEGNLRSVRIVNCRVPAKLIKAVDAGLPNAPLLSLSTFQDRRHDDQCQIMMEVPNRVEDAHWVEGNQLLWDLRFKPRIARRVAAEEDEEDEEDVSVEDVEDEEEEEDEDEEDEE